jgi:hypothetical protein
MPPSQQSPYDFITNAPQKKRGLSFGTGTSQKTRLLQVGIFGAVLLIVAVVILSLLSGAGKGSSVNLYKLAAAQQDIIDIIAAGKSTVSDTQLTNQAATINAVITSHNQETLAHLAAIGISKPAKTIATYQDSGYKNALSDAQKNGNYNEAYTSSIAFKKKLASYDQQMLLIWQSEKAN